MNRLKPRQTPKTLVENRISFAGPNAELSLYDTYLPAQHVDLAAGELLYCGMISGRKILHGRNNYHAEFFPQESFVMAPGEQIQIDFPDASLQSPTSCLTIEISQSRIDQICDQLNHRSPLQTDFDTWQYRHDNVLHSPHTQATQALLERLVANFSEDGADRDLLIDWGISELVVRMLRQQTRDFLLQTCQKKPDLNGLSAVLQHIRSHLSEPLAMENLCRIACMSRSRFFSEFKKHLGCTPAEFQHQLRMQQARERIGKGEVITRVCFDLGYRNPSHFSRRFHQFYGETPTQCQRRHESSTST